MTEIYVDMDGVIADFLDKLVKSMHVERTGKQIPDLARSPAKAKWNRFF